MPSTRVSAEAAATAAAVLEVTDLTVTFAAARGAITAASDVTLSVAPGECLGVVGESGAGKSQVFLALLGLLAANGRAAGSARFLGRELLGLAAADLDRVRGAGIGLVFQDPMTSLTPHLTVGRAAHRGHDPAPEAGARRGALARARPARACADERSRAAHAAVPARALRRHAPARDDRDRTRLRAATADRGRADHLARCHRAGADPGAARASSSASAPWRWC